MSDRYQVRSRTAFHVVDTEADPEQRVGPDVFELQEAADRVAGKLNRKEDVRQERAALRETCGFGAKMVIEPHAGGIGLFIVDGDQRSYISQSNDTPNTRESFQNSVNYFAKDVKRRADEFDAETERLIAEVT